LGDTPYFNEPGVTQEMRPGDVDSYNSIIRHETLRVAVCNTLEEIGENVQNCPAVLKEIMKASFEELSYVYRIVQSVEKFARQAIC